MSISWTWPAPDHQIPDLTTKGVGHVDTWLLWEEKLQVGSACPHKHSSGDVLESA